MSLPPGNHAAKNVSGEEIPAYACVRITDSDLDAGQLVVEIDKPNGSAGTYAFNGPTKIAIAGSGRVSNDFGVKGLGTGSPSVLVGPDSGGWTVSASGSPLTHSTLGDLGGGKLSLTAATSTGGSSLRLGYVFDDLPGYIPDSDLGTLPSLARCLFKDRLGAGYEVKGGTTTPALPTSASYALPHAAGADNEAVALTYDIAGDSWSVGSGSTITATALANGSFLETDTSINVDNVVITNNSFPGFTEAEPGFGVTIDLESGDCSTLVKGLSIDLPISSNNRVDSASGEDTTVVISGRGSDPKSTVAVTLDGISYLTTVNPDGLWYTASIDISATAMARGPIPVTAIETDIDSFAGKAVHAAFTYTKGRSQADLDDKTPATPTVAPDLLSTSDTGGDTADNLTADQTPTIRVTSPLAPVAEGPVPVLYSNGVEIARGDVNSFPATEPFVADLTPTTLAEGTHRITYTLEGYEPGGTEATRYASGHSSGLDIVIDLNADDGLITATAEVVTTFDEGDPTISVTNVVINNPTADPDPTAPTSVPQPAPPAIGTAGDTILLKYLGGVWIYFVVTKWCREVSLIQNADAWIVLGVGPCRYKVPDEIVARMNENPLGGA